MRKLLNLFFISLFWILFIGTCFAQPDDWLKDSYDYSHKPPASNNPYTSDIEADDMFNSNATIGTDWIWVSDSVLVRLARFLMRIWVMLWIPLLIFGWIKVALSLGDQWKLKEALKLIWYLVAWLLLMLFSVAIVYLITSLTRSSLEPFKILG